MSLLDDLIQWFYEAQKIVIVGIGNPMRKDDGIGIEIVSGLEGKISSKVLLIKSETVPEDFIEPIIEFKPTHILIVDAALMSLQPGSAELIKSVPASELGFSTHSLSAQILCGYLTMMTGAEIAMLLIQPEDTSFGEGLTQQLDLARKELIYYLVKIVELMNK